MWEPWTDIIGPYSELWPTSEHAPETLCDCGDAGDIKSWQMFPKAKEGLFSVLQPRDPASLLLP